MLDLGSYLAAGSENSPHDNPKGNALIVYDPGLTGAGRRAASWIATDLQNMRYNVTVAGIRSADAMNASGRDVVIFIGPTLAGKPPGSGGRLPQNVTVRPGLTGRHPCDTGISRRRSRHRHAGYASGERHLRDRDGQRRTAGQGHRATVLCIRDPIAIVNYPMSLLLYRLIRQPRRASPQRPQR